jgi:hypothetical protein
MSNVEKLAKDLRFLVWLFIYVYAGLALVHAAFGLGMDDSDASKFNRSGLKLHTDHLTGCQYFQAPNGGLAPRVNKYGFQICTKE